MNTPLEPDPEFARHLEWQLRTELRRRARAFAGPVAPTPGPPSRVLRWARVAALVTFAFLLGGAGVYAAERYQAQARAELELARAELRLELAARRAQALVRDAERVEAVYQAGLVGVDARLAARGRAEEAEHTSRRRQLDLEEVRGSGLAPRDELSAPRVDGRDFVAARLELERARIEQALVRLREHLEVGRQRYEAGVAPIDSTRAQQVELHRAESAQRALELRLSLRASCLAGELDGRRVDLFADEVRVLAATEELGELLELARGRLQLSETRFAAGLVTDSEVAGARMWLEELEVELALVEIELEVLRTELDR